MDGPPGSQGIIVRKGRKHRKGKSGGASQQTFKPGTTPPATASEVNENVGSSCGPSPPAKQSASTATESRPGELRSDLPPTQRTNGNTKDGQEETQAPPPANNRSNAHPAAKPIPKKSSSAAAAKPVQVAQEIRDLSHPNIPLQSLSLRQLYLRASGFSSGAPSARSGHGMDPRFAQHFDLLPYPRGITNNTNYCFMNSVMQALTFIPGFAQMAISAMEEAETCPTLATLGKWMVQYWKAGLTRQAIQPPRFNFSMTADHDGRAGAAASVDGTSQQDAQEFLQRLLEVVHAELKDLEMSAQDAEEVGSSSAAGGTETSSAAGAERRGARLTTDTTPCSSTRASSSKGWTVVKGKERLTVREHKDEDGCRSLLLDSLFGGTIDSHLKGKSKQRDHASVVVEPFYCLPVDIGFQAECTVESAIERTMTTERIYDPTRDKELKKTLMLDRLPNLLFLHLRRWAVTAEGELVKLDNTVKFGRTLVLPRNVCADDTLSNKARTYRLLSVVVHRGTATGRGHYVTYLTAHVANPTNVSVAGSANSHAGPQPYTKQQLQQIHHPKGESHRARNGAAAPAAQTRHPMNNPAQVVLCNDTKVSVVPATDMLKETVYFLVYQKAN